MKISEFSRHSSRSRAITEDFILYVQYGLSLYKNIICGFVLDFRLSEKTYFVNILEFNYMIDKLDKKSFNESDLIHFCNPIEINKKKLKVNCKYDIDNLLEKARY